MFMITTLIEPSMGKLILNHLIANNCPGICNELQASYFFKLTLGSDCLELHFWVVAFKTILTQFYYKNISLFQIRPINKIRHICCL